MFLISPQTWNCNSIEIDFLFIVFLNFNFQCTHWLCQLKQVFIDGFSSKAQSFRKWFTSFFFFLCKSRFQYFPKFFLLLQINLNRQMTKATILIEGCNTETLFDSCSRCDSNFRPGMMLASSTVPTLPSPLTGATSKLLRVVVVHVLGRGLVVVLGPFRDRITSSQFHLGCWGNETAIETIERMTKNSFTTLTSIVCSDLVCSLTYLWITK